MKNFSKQDHKNSNDSTQNANSISLSHGVDTEFKKIKMLTGTVVSTKMKDTVTVEVNRFVKHPKYKKYVVRTKKYLAHDPGNTKKEGERVMIVATRPISKHKHFVVVAEGTQTGRGKNAKNFISVKSA